MVEVGEKVEYRPRKCRTNVVYIYIVSYSCINVCTTLPRPIFHLVTSQGERVPQSTDIFSGHYQRRYENFMKNSENFISI